MMRIIRLIVPPALMSAVLLGGALPTARAQSGPSVGSPAIWSAGSNTIHHTSLRSQGFPDTTTHYLYIDTGNCPNSLDVYQVTGKTVTFLQNFAVPNACQQYSYVPSNALGYSAPCLVLADYSGNIFSFRVDQSTHRISAQVSQIPDPFGDEPTDVKISGSTAIVTSDSGPAGELASYAIAADCTLTNISAAFLPGNPYSSAVVGGRWVVAPAHSLPSIFAFTLAADGALTYSYATRSQLPEPQSIATSGNSVETGGSPGLATVEAGTIDARGKITWDPNSPQTDPNSSGSYAAWYDPVFKHWVEGDLYSDSISFFSKSPFAYQSTVSTPDHSSPASFQQVGTTLTWLDFFTASVEYCTVTPAGCGTPQVAISSIQNGLQLGGYVVV